MTLAISNLDVSIAGIPILRGVTMEIPSGKMVGLIGRNGAGKTTLIRSIMGLTAISGNIVFDGTSIGDKEAHTRAGMGISYLPEDRRLIPSLTVEENILMPAWANKLKDAPARLEWIYSLMPEIAQYRDRKALQLSGGQQKLVALGRALMPARRLLLLDEPFEGVAPVLSRRLTEVIGKLRSEGLCVLLSESDATHSSDLVDQVFNIERGVVTTN
ncbi:MULTISPECIES: branched-chain amino acid ABC transporter ATP-binding protein [Xanthobacter]|uniref:branched-chain amino acid ABC transporter ATP-binding protein n=1 Tax=Xanthobacter TaxID=279 RepID=UPI001F47F2F8|nr:MULTISPECIES: ABC transporter ATP-binding protein [unclassified Xanthobacter]